MSERIAFRMVLNAGGAAEYKRRHDDIWPELVELLRDVGVSDYTIWLDPETDHLYATLVRSDRHDMARLPDTDIMKRWWAMMGDIMETNVDTSPVQVDLQMMFSLP